jgi:hypothetical protein
MVRMRHGADPDLVVRHPDGFHAAIAMSWTDYANPSGPPQVALAPPHLLDVAGLCQAVQFIEHLRQSNRYPTVAEPDSACQPNEAPYDGRQR